jgi:hypothetical protein
MVRVVITIDFTPIVSGRLAIEESQSTVYYQTLAAAAASNRVGQFTRRPGLAWRPIQDIAGRKAFKAGVGRVQYLLLNTFAHYLTPPSGSGTGHAAALTIALVLGAGQSVITLVMHSSAKCVTTNIFFRAIVAIIAGTI